MTSTERFARFKQRGAPLMIVILTLSLATLVVGYTGITLWHSSRHLLGGILVATAVAIATLNREIADPYWVSKDNNKPRADSGDDAR